MTIFPAICVLLSVASGTHQEKSVRPRAAASEPTQRTDTRKAPPGRKRAWGPEQATGEPDSPDSSDAQTAWASLGADTGDEWLLLTYEEPVHALSVHVHENHKPGALRRVTVFGTDGKEVEVWKGADPTAADQERGVSEVSFQVSFKIKRVKLYLASSEVAGWNEIDAVGLKDPNRKMHWASEADASTTYARVAEPAPVAPPPPVVPEVPIEKRIEQLEEKMRAIRRELDELKKRVAEKKK